MRYSTRTRYGLRFLINLASRPLGACVRLGEMAREEGISVKYLEQIVRVLRPAGILRSVRGARGGYTLARAPEAICMEDVFGYLEGSIAPVECLRTALPCEREPLCPTQWFWTAFDENTRTFLRGVTLDRFVERNRAAAAREEERGKMKAEGNA